ncbi:DUF6063 family protein [Tumebacillus permanentifrigoris]|uniref:Uncharacterized protein n=1 Tax=Tumebacillus permanentifrigoris TaxID=378543 RepID=A0A316DDB8_9BACL|nr:DUF6063 family protein [Tumebacillus permanentifrigoris]PWK13458.1 hypothetical protein C7459_107126 [Tumebacillus permanentifrigoris]
MYSKESVERAIKLFILLLEKGETDEKDRDLVFAYKEDPVAQEIVAQMIEKQAGIKILHVGDKLYVTPSLDNKVFGYSNDELRVKMGLRQDSVSMGLKLYLAYFIILATLAMFYNSDDLNTKVRQYVPIEELEQYVTEKLQMLGTGDYGQYLSAEYEFNFAQVAEYWQSMPAYDETLTNQRMGHKSRVSYLLKVWSFLEEEGLAKVAVDSEIHPTDKLDHMVRKYYAHQKRKDELLALIQQKEIFYA